MRSTRRLLVFTAVVALMMAAACCFTAALNTASALQPKPKATPTKPQSDGDIQKCIQDKVAASDLKNQNVQVSVNNAEAVLTSDIKTAAQQNAAQQIARGCGAHKYILQNRRAR